MTNPTSDRAMPNSTIASTSEPAGEMVTGYALWAVFARDRHAPLGLADSDAVADSDATAGSAAAAAVAELDAAVARIEQRDVTLRGWYDVSGLRADADLMVWIHGDTPETLQWALRQLRRTTLLRTLAPVWNALGVHRDAEFNKRHMPSFMLGKPPQTWVTVYPFVRSYEWYLLPDAERSAMLRDHGMKGAAFRTTLANTVASFALGDYEWILALEDENLLNLVDMMRDLRQTDARRHVREEVPFFTGRRIPTTDIVEVLL
ncbi:hydrogen peroxide-dependent heme synthase [Subtercola sp. RTI3]|uniref:hydrogen peroxide-dependent heme synthase n=1 Tax=Subtercola sp. RTI3 TaxID=3048639 RepID=UPI002B22DAA3|nr:hydrogen peroxide-dependent heme synthase [Subtercola sp. RTI3]MEA9986121.1 chlorite dismutase family protein [Subtercola sp. RTI3]